MGVTSDFAISNVFGTITPFHKVHRRKSISRLTLDIRWGNKNVLLTLMAIILLRLNPPILLLYVSLSTPSGGLAGHIKYFPTLWTRQFCKSCFFPFAQQPPQRHESTLRWKTPFHSIIRLPCLKPHTCLWPACWMLWRIGTMNWR